jgi:hypothetical protein
MSDIYLGMEVHQASITIAVLPTHAPVADPGRSDT